jgi:hypothetical protein
VAADSLVANNRTCRDVQNIPTVDEDMRKGQRCHFLNLLLSELGKEVQECLKGNNVPNEMYKT